MPGRLHRHKGGLYYHRKDGAHVIHGRRHSKYTMGLDMSIDAKTKQTKKGVGIYKRRRGYPHTGDKKGSKRKI
jgi:hypothetical protein